MTDTRNALASINPEQLTAILELVRAAPDHANSDTIADVVEYAVRQAAERHYEVVKLTRIAIDAVYQATGNTPLEQDVERIVTAVWDHIYTAIDPHADHMHGVMPDDNAYPDDAPADPREHGVPTDSEAWRKDAGFEPEFPGQTVHDLADLPKDVQETLATAQASPANRRLRPTRPETPYIDPDTGRKVIAVIPVERVEVTTETDPATTPQSGVQINDGGATDPVAPTDPPITDISDSAVLRDIREESNLTSDTPREWAVKSSAPDPDRLAASPQFGVPRHSLDREE